MSAPDPNTTTASAPSTDVAPETAEADVTGLNDLLADATVFYQKVRHYHWNVTGPHFFTLHEEFEALYTFWNDAIDEIAEQVRSRGDRPVHTLADVLDLASLEEDPSTPAGPRGPRRAGAAACRAGRGGRRCRRRGHCARGPQ
jgi:starvation-inducible DNA-binding protein